LVIENYRFPVFKKWLEAGSIDGPRSLQNPKSFILKKRRITEKWQAKKRAGNYRLLYNK